MRRAREQRGLSYFLFSLSIDLSSKILESEKRPRQNVMILRYWHRRFSRCTLPAYVLIGREPCDYMHVSIPGSNDCTYTKGPRYVLCRYPTLYLFAMITVTNCMIELHRENIDVGSGIGSLTSHLGTFHSVVRLSTYLINGHDGHSATPRRLRCLSRIKSAMLGMPALRRVRRVWTTLFLQPFESSGSSAGREEEEGYVGSATKAARSGGGGGGGRRNPPSPRN